jgi:Flp pilus assembly protein CpaB
MVRLGGGAATSSRQSGSAEAGPAPAARRLGSSRWRDPRLAVGVVLIAGSVVLGARVVAAADDTIPVWSLRDDVTAGAELTAEDVTVSHVHFDEADAADRYFDGDESIPDGLVVDHDLAEGELLARSALVEPDARSIDELPLPVADGFYPTDLASGDRVDVWVAPSDGTDRDPRASLVLADVSVLQIDTGSSSIGGGASTVVLVGLEPDAAGALDEALAAITNGSVFLVRVSE